MLERYVQKKATISEPLGNLTAVATFEEITLKDIVWVIRCLNNEKTAGIVIVSAKIIKEVVCCLSLYASTVIPAGGVFED